MTAAMARVVACFSLLLAQNAAALNSSHLALVVNRADPLSVEIGAYYAARRHILFQNVISVAFTPGRTTLAREEFAAIKAEVDAQVLPNVQAYALAWTVPYRVECMSITSAFAFGFDTSLCAGGCAPTRRNPYYDSPVRRPFRRHGIRPAMALAAASFEEAKALIDRGVSADGSFPRGAVYLLSTSDAARNVRSVSYLMAEKVLQGRLRVHRLNQDSLTGAADVLLYFTGKERVDGLDTLSFLPGAIADHLTSAGGQLTDSPQMSALRWLDAGATASYGTVVEPCSIRQKFPDPAVLAAHYLRGDTLIEAYWKSVAMPGQGIFIGEPLAAPFRRAGSGR